MKCRFSMILATAFVLLWCGIQVDAASRPDTLVVATSLDDMISLDPAETFEFTGQEVIANVYDRIMMYEAEDISKLVGGVAESWSVSEDGKTITFQLRKGLKFHSGNPVTADDAVFSLRRVIKLDKTPAFIFKQFGWTKDNIDDLVAAAGSDTFKLTIKEEFAPSLVLNCLAAGVGSVVDKKLVMSHEKDGDMGNEWLKRNSAGGGAFVLNTWRPNDAVVLEGFADYRHGAPKVKRVVLRHVNEATTQRLLLETGDADIARGLNTDQLEKLAFEPGLKVESFPQAAVHFFGLNQKVQKLQNPKVWEAMRYLVDYDTMVQTFLKGQYIVHQAFWPRGFPGALTDTPYRLDVDKAKQLLKEAGYPDGFSVDMDVINAPVFMDMAQTIQQTFARAGIKVNIIPGTGAQVITKYRNRSHELLLIYWGPDYMDPHSNAASFAYNADNSDAAKISSGAWRNAWDMPELSKKTAAAAIERDSEKRLQMYMDLQREVQKSSPYVIMFQANSQLAMKQSVEGFVSGPTTDTIFYRNVVKH